MFVGLRTGTIFRYRLVTLPGISSPQRAVLARLQSESEPERRCQEGVIFTLALSTGLFRMGRMVIKKQEESVLETEVTRVKPPPLFKVMLLNDDFTPMDFVVTVSQKFFGKDREQATRIMLKVHREGVGVCGVFPRDIASTKVEQVIAYARQNQHPLACIMEEN